MSCHGLKDDAGHLYFAAADTEVDALDATAVSAVPKPPDDAQPVAAHRAAPRLLYSGAFVAA
jgi:hypothetical protein